MSNIVDLPTKSKPVVEVIELEKKLDLGLDDEANTKGSFVDIVRRRLKFAVYKIGCVHRRLKKVRGSVVRFFYGLIVPALVAELTYEAMKANRKTFHVMLHISGHVNDINLTVHLGGYAKDKNRKIELLRGYLPHKKLSKMRPKDIRHAIKLLKLLSKGQYERQR